MSANSLGLRESLILPIARHYIAGTATEDIVGIAKNLNALGFKVLANYLGEDLVDEEQIKSTLEEYTHLVDIMDENRLSGSISVKLTQLGLIKSQDEALQNMQKLVNRARTGDRFVWIDMESSKYTDATIDIYCKILKTYRNLGIAVQAYLKRSEEDVKRLLEVGGQIRLVKGAYREPRELLVGGRSAVRENFSKLLALLFAGKNFFAVATHDEKLLTLAIRLVKETRNQNFEFQLLRGVREDRSRQLLNDGYNVSIYVPYGEKWLPYALRRIRERRRNLFYFMKVVLHV